MLRGFYTAASGMITQQRQQEALANNIANANTPGYKADQTSIRSFPELLIHHMGAKRVPTTNNLTLPVNRPIGSLNTGVYVQEVIPNFSQGDLRETGIATDLSLVVNDVPEETGNIFFTVQNSDGDVRLTRNGNFTVDGNGMLVTTQGYYVLDDTGEPIETNGLEFTVTNEGLIQLDDQAIQLGLTYVDDVNGLTKEGNDLYEGAGEDVPVEAMYHIHQGFLERSNVDSLQTMTDMMEAYRMFELNQRVLRAYDQNMEKAVNDVGRIG